MPYGELFLNQQTSHYNERFKFTGKERDTETGYDYFGARFYSPDIAGWLSPDPLSDKYPSISPYAYCNWNPVRNIDINGCDWFQNEDGQILWTKYHNQQEMSQNNQKGKYLGEAVIIFEGFKDEHFGTLNGNGQYLGGDNSKLANVTLFGPQNENDISYGLVGFTMTSNYKLYGAIDDGIWPANYDYQGKSGTIKSNWTLNHRSLIPTYDYQPNFSPYAGLLKGSMYKDGIFIHSTLEPNNKVGSTTSTGCLLLDWDSMQLFNHKMQGVHNFSVIITRQ